jgi:hypothetical protein
MAQTKIKAGLFEGIIGNGTDGYFLMSNGDGTMTWSSIVINPTITSIAYPGSVTAADPAGGETITVTGTGFKTGATVTIGGTAAPAVSYVSATQITFTTPAKAAGDYDIVVTNTDTGSATYINGISYNGIPTWTTAAGSLGTFASDTTISTITLQATEPDAGTITFSITNGALPTGLSLTGANIDGTTTLETADTLYTFTVTATDDESQATPRTFTITVTKQFIGTENFTINTYAGNGSTQSIEGKIGTAAQFDGSGDYITTPQVINANSSFSLSMWVNPVDVSGCMLYVNAINNGFAFGYDIDNTTQGLGVWKAGVGTLFTSGNDVTANTWQHLVLTYDGSGNWEIYKDGVSIHSQSSTTYTFASATNSYIGRDFSTSFDYNGKIDQFRIFNKALSSSEVTTLYGENNTSTTKSTTDIFDDGSGVALYEFEKGAKDTGGVNGYIGAAGVFNGSSSGIVVNNSVFPTKNLFSVSTWFKTTATTFQTILYTGAIASANNGWALYTTASGFLHFAVVSVTSPGYNDIATTNAVNDGAWHHIVITFDTSANYNVYLDGNTTALLSGTSTRNPTTYSDNFLLGYADSSSPGSFFTGSIDQVRIFNKVLLSSEVTTLYGETSASATKSTTDIFGDSSGVALYELEGNANDTGGTYNGTPTNVSYAYDGTPTNVSFVGTSFQPDLVWVKNRNGTFNNMLTDSINGDNTHLIANTTAALDTSSSAPQFNTNGFTLGGLNNNWNGSSYTYVAWCWKAASSDSTNTNGSITSTVRANQDAGFSIVKYNSGTTAVTAGHGLLQKPEMLICKPLVTGSWAIWHKDFADLEQTYIPFTTSAAIDVGSNIWNYSNWGNDKIGSVNPTMFGNSNDVIAYCFHSVDGYQKVGSYTGNGSSTGPVVTVGFEPRFLVIKRTDTSGYGWYIMDSVRGMDGNTGKFLFADSSSQEGTLGAGGLQPNLTGFQITDSGAGFNANGGTYIYLAIA